MKRPDLLLLVAIWAFFSAFLYFAGIVPIAVFAFPETLGFGYGPASVSGSIALGFAIFVLLCCAGLSLAGGIGIVMAKSWGRIISIVVAILSCFWFPVGTVIGVLVIIYLTRSEVREYFEGNH